MCPITAIAATSAATVAVSSPRAARTASVHVIRYPVGTL